MRGQLPDSLFWIVQLQQFLQIGIRKALDGTCQDEFGRGDGSRVNLKRHAVGVLQIADGLPSKTTARVELERSTVVLVYQVQQFAVNGTASNGEIEVAIAVIVSPGHAVRVESVSRRFPSEATAGVALELVAVVLVVLVYPVDLSSVADGEVEVAIAIPVPPGDVTGLL